ncbi:MAG: hypothetical protein KC506_01040 [Nanoarchaeota archaeon]|nr:hypothetical protein [Nanoarchaeota archaeon]
MKKKTLHSLLSIPLAILNASNANAQVPTLDHLIETKPVEKDPSWKTALAKEIPGMTGVGNAIQAENLFFYRLDSKEDGWGNHLFINSQAVGNFTNQGEIVKEKSHNNRYDEEKREGIPQITQPQRLVNFCTDSKNKGEIENREITCGYAIIENTSNTKNQSVTETVTNFQISDELPLMAGKIYGVNIKPVNGKIRTSFAVRNYVRDGNAVYEQTDLLDLRSDGKLKSIGRDIKRLKELPEDIPYHLVKTSEGLKVAAGPFSPFKSWDEASNYLTELFPEKIGEWNDFYDMNYDSIEVTNSEEGTQVNLEHIACGDVLNLIDRFNEQPRRRDPRVLCRDGLDKYIRAEMNITTDGVSTYFYPEQN